MMARTPMGKATVFVSYPSQLREIASRLNEELSRDFEVLWDRTGLVAGDEYHDKLETWAMECDGAVVLCSPDAEASSWVLHEAGILSMRMRRGTRPPCVVPLLVDGFDARRLKAGPLAVARLHELQAFKLTNDYDALRKLLVTRLRDRTPPRGSPEYHLAIAALLNTAGRDAIECVCRTLQIDGKIELVRDKGACLAHHLLDLSLERLEEVVSALGPIDAGCAGRLIDLLFPLTWVEAGAARTLAEHAQKRPSPGPIALRAREERTPLMYVRRASDRPFGWPTASCAAKWSHQDPASALIAEIRIATAPKLGLLPDSFTVEEFDDELSRLKTPLVVVLPPQFADLDAALLGEVTEVFAGMVLFVRSVRPLEGWITKLRNAVRLPDLDETVERRAWSSRRRIEEFFRDNQK
jgi:hypothetical protein